ncbi:hypothetical protein CDAR_60051 [Caerostris darwini]|uniref:Uncharacterized protein n=1 Tax=Caerostris darwini TaxID=1538125 RepID=A0AAV4QN81_9ARAC|nr:hypothetical protein CDAR_60051 [Caerostris darwini]
MELELCIDLMDSGTIEIGREEKEGCSPASRWNRRSFVKGRQPSLIKPQFQSPWKAEIADGTSRDPPETALLSSPPLLSLILSRTFFTRNNPLPLLRIPSLCPFLRICLHHSVMNEIQLGRHCTTPNEGRRQSNWRKDLFIFDGGGRRLGK